MNAYGIGISALNAGQKAIELIGQNVSNSATPGYHRQVVNLTSRSVNGVQGTGVEIDSITRMATPNIRPTILNSTGETSRLSTQAGIQQQAEALFSTSSDAIGSQIESFFNQLQQTTARPDDISQRRIAVDQADALASRFNSLSNDLYRLRNSTGQQVGDTVSQINSLSPRISSLNARISQIESGGQQANDLRDQRDQLIRDLSGLVDVRISPQENGIINVVGGGAPLVVGNESFQLKASKDASGNYSITSPPSSTSLKVGGGKLGALLTEHNVTLPAQMSQLDAMAQKFMEKLDQVQATGMGKNGPVTSMSGVRPVSDPNIPLASAGLSIPMVAGTLTIAVTDLSTGQRTHSSISIDPSTMSMQGVAGAISTGTGGKVIGSVDSTSNTLRLQSSSGYSFDLTGMMPSPAPVVNMNGTSTPDVQGTYTGENNDAYSFQISGSGTIGTTPGLSMEVRNSANSVIATLNVGEGYTPGSTLSVANGVTVKLGAGTTNNGSFSTPVISNPDTSGMLAALGVNSMFTGTSAGSMAVRPELVADPSKLSVGLSNQPGDSKNLERMLTLRDKPVLNNNSQTFGEFFGDIVGTVGSNVQSLSDQRVTQTNILQSLDNEEQSIAGVDINEEMVNLLQYQRMVDSASRYLSVVNRAMDSIMEIVR